MTHQGLKDGRSQDIRRAARLSPGGGSKIRNLSLFRAVLFRVK
jgi:hypothetical protein